MVLWGVRRDLARAGCELLEISEHLYLVAPGVAALSERGHAVRVPEEALLKETYAHGVEATEVRAGSG